MKIAFVVYGEILAPVVKSQTLPLLRGVAAAGHEVHLVAVVSPRRWLTPGRWRDTLLAARDAAGGRLTVLAHPPRHAMAGWTARRIDRILRRIGPDVVHARQSRAAALAIRGGAAPVLLDLRGVRPEEYLLSLGRKEADLSIRESQILARLRAEDAAAIAGAAGIVVVSQEFHDHLGGEGRIRVIPNAGEEVPTPSPNDRQALRAGFGLAEGDVAFVYSGSLASWQCAAEAVALVRELLCRIPAARLVLLTHDEPGGKNLLAAAGVPGEVQSLTPEETRRSLPAFDAALLLRAPNLVNRVAAPVKFAEYLHAGLPVILTEGIGDCSGWVREHRLGVVLPDPGDPGNADRVVAAIASFDGERCRAFARERLTFRATVPLYLDAFRAAAGRRG